MRVLVVTLSFGAGHTQAAKAVAAELRRRDPAPHVRVVDALDGAAWWFRLTYVLPYWLMVRYAPGLWRRFFAARLRGGARETAPPFAFRLGCGHVFRLIRDWQPDVIVAAEVGAGEIAAEARRRGMTSAPIVSVITDHHAEPAWVHPEVAAYAVADDSVRTQLTGWGADAASIVVTGIPIDARFAARTDASATRAKYGLEANDGRPLVLLMGGGMGPTRMDLIAAGLCASGAPVHVVAVAGRDETAVRRLASVRPSGTSTLQVRGWVEDVPALMQAAAVLVTKPGGLTGAEAAVCGVPTVLFDTIPGPEEHNANRLASAGAGVRTRGTRETVAAVLSLLEDEPARAAMAARARALAAPGAAAGIADAVLATRRDQTVLLLTISNGSGHTRVAEAIAEAVEDSVPRAPSVKRVTTIVNVADYMSPLVRFTHITAYLWLVRRMPGLWARIDRFQKQQEHTSPVWFYRQGCQRLFSLVDAVQPAAIVATEVGCLEIAAVIKRDLGLTCPLLAVNGEYDADRAWVQPEVDAYSVPTPEAAEQLHQHGAERLRIHVWGVPLERTFAEPVVAARAALCRELGFDPLRPILLVAGGSEGLGSPELIVETLSGMPTAPQFIVLAGRNGRLRKRCEAMGATVASLRVFGWTRRVRELMAAADLLISKPGHTFDEAMAAGIPLISLPPPPGSEEVQVALLDAWNVGRAVKTLADLSETVTRVLADPLELRGMQISAMERRNIDAAGAIAGWLDAAIADGSLTAARPYGALVPRRLELTVESGR